MKKIMGVAAIMLVSLGMSAQANAAASCIGTVSLIYSNNNGDVIINGSWRNASTQICNLKTIWKGIDPEICWGWFANASTAVSEDRNARVFYATLNQSDCATLGTLGTAPAPTSFLLY